jgi:hypothetical protein
MSKHVVHTTDTTSSTVTDLNMELEGPGYLSRYSDSVRAGRAGDQIPVGARFSVPV